MLRFDLIFFFSKKKTLIHTYTHASTQTHSHILCNLFRWSIMNWINVQKAKYGWGFFFFPLFYLAYLRWKRQCRTFYEPPLIHLINNKFSTFGKTIPSFLCNSQFYYVCACVLIFDCYLTRASACINVTFFPFFFYYYDDFFFLFFHPTFYFIFIFIALVVLLVSFYHTIVSFYAFQFDDYMILS